MSRHGGAAFEWRSRQLSFYTSRVWVRRAPLPSAAAAGAGAGAGAWGGGEWRRVEVPEDAEVSHFGDRALVTLRLEREGGLERKREREREREREEREALVMLRLKREGGLVTLRCVCLFV